jgi:hypothetical protein
MPRLVTTNPELFENPTLGEANPLPFLEEVEAQRVEDRNARFEKREPGIAVRDVRYPALPPSGTVPSTVANTVTIVSPDEDFGGEFNFEDE